MKSFKTVNGFLKHLSYLATHQDMSECKGWDKLTDEEQRLFYAIIAGIQNDLGEMQSSFDNRNYKQGIYRG